MPALPPQLQQFNPADKTGAARRLAWIKVAALLGMLYGAVSLTGNPHNGVIDWLKASVFFLLSIVVLPAFMAANRLGRAGIVGAMVWAFLVSGAPTSKGGTRGQHAWAAFDNSMDSLRPVVGDQVDFTLALLHRYPPLWLGPALVAFLGLRWVFRPARGRV